MMIETMKQLSTLTYNNQRKCLAPQVIYIIFYNYENDSDEYYSLEDSDEYYSLEDFDVSTNDI